VWRRSRTAVAEGEHALGRRQQQVQHLTDQRAHGLQPCSPCPVCRADLTVRPVPEGDCPLCLSALDPAVLAQSLHAAQDTLAAAERQLTEQVKAHSEARTAWEQARIELDARTRRSAPPLRPPAQPTLGLSGAGWRPRCDRFLPRASSLSDSGHQRLKSSPSRSAVAALPRRPH
jgi:hypothetical protein